MKSNIVAISLLQKKLSVQENGIVEITQRTIEVSEDSDDVGKLAIKVVDKPQHGIIEKEGRFHSSTSKSKLFDRPIKYQVNLVPRTLFFLLKHLYVFFPRYPSINKAEVALEIGFLKHPILYPTKQCRTEFSSALVLVTSQKFV